MIRSVDIRLNVVGSSTECHFKGEYSVDNGGLYVCHNTLPMFDLGENLYSYDKLRDVIFQIYKLDPGLKTGSCSISIILDYPIEQGEIYYDQLYGKLFDVVTIAKAKDVKFIEKTDGGFKYAVYCKNGGQIV